MNSHETDCGYGEGNCNGNLCSGGGGSKNCAYRNNGNDGRGGCNTTPLLETTADDVVAAYNGGGPAAAAVVGGVDDWQLVQTDFADAVPPGSDTSIRCVVQPPPDMLATHVCVEVGLVKSSAAIATDAADKPEMPTIVVCSVDVEPCRKQQHTKQPAVPEATDKTVTCSAVAGDDDGDMLDRISQDLDYLLNRKTAAAAGAQDPSTGADPTECCHYDRADRTKLQQQQQQDYVAADVMVQKRTKL